MNGQAPFGPRTPLPFALALALLCVLSFVVAANPGPLPGDRAAADLFEALRSPWLTERVERLTFFGSGYVVWPLVAVIGVGLAAVRRYPELTVIVVAALVILIAVPELKQAVERPRPTGSLVPVSSYSFPSGHATQGAWYVFLALLALHLSPRISRPRLLLGAATLFCLLIGLSRIYLGAHYLSDVIGGWALALVAFTLWPLLQHARGRLRQNLEQ